MKSITKRNLQYKALYIPLADHYAALVAYERYPQLAVEGGILSRSLDIDLFADER